MIHSVECCTDLILHSTPLLVVSKSNLICIHYDRGPSSGSELLPDWMCLLHLILEHYVMVTASSSFYGRSAPSLAILGKALCMLTDDWPVCAATSEKSLLGSSEFSSQGEKIASWPQRTQWELRHSCIAILVSPVYLWNIYGRWQVSLIVKPYITCCGLVELVAYIQSDYSTMEHLSFIVHAVLGPAHTGDKLGGAANFAACSSCRAANKAHWRRQSRGRNISTLTLCNPIVQPGAFRLAHKHRHDSTWLEGFVLVIVPNVSSVYLLF